jgi:hypothetical protein
MRRPDPKRPPPFDASPNTKRRSPFLMLRRCDERASSARKLSLIPSSFVRNGGRLRSSSAGRDRLRGYRDIE